MAATPAESSPAFVAYHRVRPTSRPPRASARRPARRRAHLVASHGATGAQLTAEYAEGECDRRSARPQLLRALAASRRHRAGLVVSKLDRLTRDPRFLGTLRDARVPFVADDDPHATELTVDILAAVAADEARRTAERTRAASRSRRPGARCWGGWRTSPPPAGR